MSAYNNYPIYYEALKLTTYLDDVVCHFAKRHKYNAGDKLLNLNELDQFVKHTLKAHYYLRYVDDFVILSPDASQLRTWQAQIEEFLTNRLKLRLHPKRRKLLPISNGIDFLGYIVRPTYVLVRRRVINNLKEKIRQFRQVREKDFRKFHDMVASYMGHLRWANSYNLTQKILKEM